MICAKVTRGKVVVLLQVSLLLICFVLDCLCGQTSGALGPEPEPEQARHELNRNANSKTSRINSDDKLRTAEHGLSGSDDEHERYCSELDRKLANFHWRAESAIQVNTDSQIKLQEQQATGPREPAPIRNPQANLEADASASSEGHHRHQIHRHMSRRDLRRVFQVESHDQVPEYEIIAVHARSKPLGRPRPHAAHSVRKRAASADLELQPDAERASSSAVHAEPSDASDRLSADDKLIVMELPIFGQDYKLRLKRNVEFQQKIHNMPMFMAETTKDGRLRYTEVSKSARAAAGALAANNSSRQEQQAPSRQPAWMPIGSTYHDEQNLAALLIDQDTRTGHFRVDGTIGNDFVIKPMPASAIEALESHQRRLGRQRPEEAASGSAPADERQNQVAGQSHIKSNRKPSNKLVAKIENQDQSQPKQSGRPEPVISQSSSKPNLVQLPAASGFQGDRALSQASSVRQRSSLISDSDIAGLAAASSSSAASSADTTTRTGAASTDKSDKSDLQRIPESRAAAGQTELGGGGATGAYSKRDTGGHAQMMHEHDDPHDDDEMFLDEDEAIEMAHQHQLQTSNDSTNNHATGQQQTSLAPNLPQTNSTQSNRREPINQLSKSASERKWRKYRKLMAQTKVPKANQQEMIDDRPNPGAAGSARPRRHTPDERASGADAYEQPVEVKMTHHIVFRQKPTSGEGHEHSFFALAPEQLRQQHLDMAASQSAEERLASRLVSQETDRLHDPLGGQFYLEPGFLMSAGSDDAARSWKLWSRAQNQRHSSTNNTEPGDDDDDWQSHRSGNASTPLNGRVRHKRHAGRRGPPIAGTAPVGAGNGMHANRAIPPLRAQGSQLRRKRQAPDTVYPEVLLVVDYDSFLLHGGDSRDVKRYFVSFWNGVDLRYKLLAHPNIRISLAGMIVAKDRDATPYLERNRLRSPNADAVDAAGALTDMGKYLYREDRLPTYDLAVVITKLDMCRRRFDGGRCNRGTAGFAYVGGACVVNKRLEKVNSVAIIEDSGGFSGIIVAAHEVGHLLGCVHDGSPPPNYLGGPGATHCPWEDGFIMSDLRHTERGFRWSHCSVEQFKHFLHGETATCLYNYPHESQMLHRLLPGTMLSLDEQCKRDRGTNACFKDARVCAQLFCFDSASGYCVSYRPAAEGSPCGEGQSCRNGKCVGDVENIITDYSHQSQTVVARRAQTGVAPSGSVVPAVLSAASSPAGVAASTASLARLPLTPASGSDAISVTLSGNSSPSASGMASASGITSTTASAPNSATAVKTSELANSNKQQVMSSRMDGPNQHRQHLHRQAQQANMAGIESQAGHDNDGGATSDDDPTSGLGLAHQESHDSDRGRHSLAVDQGAKLFDGRYAGGDSVGLDQGAALGPARQQFSQRSGPLAINQQPNPTIVQKQQLSKGSPHASAAMNPKQASSHQRAPAHHNQHHKQNSNDNHNRRQQQTQRQPNYYQIDNNMRLHQVTNGLYGSASTNQHSFAITSPRPTTSAGSSEGSSSGSMDADSPLEGQKQNYLLSDNHNQRQKLPIVASGSASRASHLPRQQQLSRRNDHGQSDSQLSASRANPNANTFIVKEVTGPVTNIDNSGDLDDSNSQIDLQYQSQQQQYNHMVPSKSFNLALQSAPIGSARTAGE